MTRWKLSDRHCEAHLCISGQNNLIKKVRLLRAGKKSLRLILLNIIKHFEHFNNLIGAQSFGFNFLVLIQNIDHRC
jgi:hypothetical protein